jgi:hypothetical protein
LSAVIGRILRAVLEVVEGLRHAQPGGRRRGRRRAGLGHLGVRGDGHGEPGGRAARPLGLQPVGARADAVDEDVSGVGGDARRRLGYAR